MDPGVTTVRRFEREDLARLPPGTDPGDRAHHEERLRMQERGEATYLVAWRGDRPCGRVTILHCSKYAEVRRVLGRFPELNALEAIPQGHGIGSQLIASAEERAAATGHPTIGLAVGYDNPAALRLYLRLGYVEWRHGTVIDRWIERDEAGEVVGVHADPCRYLVKSL